MDTVTNTDTVLETPEVNFIAKNSKHYKCEKN